MADTATRLLTRFNQGEMAQVELVVTQGAGPFDPPSETGVAAVRQGVARGVSTEFVDGVNILSSDLEITLEATTLNTSSLIMVDGILMQVLRVDQIPPAGKPVVTRVFVRGGGDSTNISIEGGSIVIVDRNSDLFVDSGGNNVILSGGSTFLRSPDLVDDDDALYFYWGWTDVANGSWLIRRQLRSDANTSNADITTNDGFADLAAAWPNRDTLGYL